MKYTTPLVLSWTLSIFMLFGSTALAMPISGSLNSQTRFDSLVVGVTPIRASSFPRPLPVDYDSTAQPTYISVTGSWGAPWKLTTLNQSSPSLFLIMRERLWVYSNETYILPVNVLNATVPGNPPLQLAVGNGFEGVMGGSWKWRGTMLLYVLGNESNRAMYYSCKDEDDALGLYMFLGRSPTPTGCSAMTLYAYNDASREDKRKDV